MNQLKSKLIILGSGPAGYSAAIYAARANLKPIIIQGIQPGGQLTITTDVENYPGFAEVIQGPWLMEQMKMQVESVGSRIISDTIIDARIQEIPFKLKGDSTNEYLCESLIIATGASAKWLGLDSEKKFMGFGVSACATCDAFFYKDKHVAVVGGGNTAAEEAIFLTKFASKVTIIHRRSELRAEKILQKRLFENEKINFLWDHKIIDILGTNKPPSLNKLIISCLKTNQKKELDVDGLFVAIGHNPNTALFKNQINMDNEGYIITKNNSTETSVKGVYAAGDVQDKIFRQAVTAAGFGCMASLEAEKYLDLKS